MNFELQLAYDPEVFSHSEDKTHEHGLDSVGFGPWPMGEGAN